MILYIIYAVYIVVWKEILYNSLSLSIERQSMILFAKGVIMEYFIFLFKLKPKGPKGMIIQRI